MDPIELTDWTFENPFDANELKASLAELSEIEKEDSRDLTYDEVRTMLGVIKLLAQISAGRPTDDGDYFLKDPNWTSSYAYRGFREFLMTNPREVQQFLSTLLDNDTMLKFTEALTAANAKVDAEAAEVTHVATSQGSDSKDEILEKMKAKVAEMEAEKNSNAITAAPAAD